MGLIAFREDSFPGLFIETDEPATDFVAIACDDLNQIAGYTLGKELLTLISKRTLGVGTRASDQAQGPLRCIITWSRKKSEDDFKDWAASGPLKDSTAKKPYTASKKHTDSADKLVALEQRRLGVMDGEDAPAFKAASKGYSSVALYNPKFDYAKLTKVPSPSWIVLAHELIHSLHHLSGDTNNQPRFNGDRDSWDIHEEARTVGLGLYSGIRLCENALRAQAGLQLRTFYEVAGDVDGLSSPVRLHADAKRWEKNIGAPQPAIRPLLRPTGHHHW